MSEPPQVRQQEGALPSLDVIFDIAKDRLDAQMAVIDGLDTKANFLLGAASVVIGLAIAFQAAIPLTPGLPVGSRLLHAAPLGPLLVAYIVTAYLTYRAMAVKKYSYAPDPDVLLSYLEKPMLQTKEEVARAMVDAHTKNGPAITDKAKWVRRASWLLIAEVAALVLALFTGLLVG